jgi:DNA-binding CsgD family transcriptional regulator
VGIEDFQFSQRSCPAGRVSLVISPQRAFGDRYFTQRDEALLSLFHDELARLVGTVLSAGPSPLSGLSPRLRQTLHALLAGDSEKQVALRLGISRHTAHEYIAALYRRFDVRTRAELLAYCIRRHIGPDSCGEGNRARNGKNDPLS